MHLGANPWFAYFIVLCSEQSQDSNDKENFADDGYTHRTATTLRPGISSKTSSKHGAVSTATDDDIVIPAAHPDGSGSSARLFRPDSVNRLVHELPKGAEDPLQGVMKRKVLRKVDGQVSISESFTESEVGV